MLLALYAPILSFVGGLLLIVGPHKAVGYGKHGDDGKDLVGALVPHTGNDHLRHLRVEGELRHVRAKLCQLADMIAVRKGGCLVSMIVKATRYCSEYPA